MDMMRSAIALAVLMILGAATPVLAQGGRNYDVKTMNFYLWCQEQAKLPADRCDKRTPEDEKTFTEFRSKIEAYEVPYLERQNRDARLDANILQDDPNDRTRDVDIQRRGSNPSPPVARP